MLHCGTKMVNKPSLSFTKPDVLALRAMFSGFAAHPARADPEFFGNHRFPSPETSGGATSCAYN